MLCVITCHSCAFWNGRWFSYLTPTFDNFAVGMFADWLGSFQIPAFVLISGFIYSYIIDNMNSYSQSLKFIKKKATRLLLPYYFVTIIWLLPIHYFIYGDIDKVLIARYLMGGGEQLWFMYMLFFVFIIFHFTYTYVKKHIVIECIYIFAAYISGCHLEWEHLNYLQVAVSLKYMLYFWIGYKFWNYRRLILLYNKFVIFLLIGSNLLLYCFYTQPSCSHKTFVCLLLNLEGAVTAFITLTKLGSINIFHNRYTKLIQSNNFVMYLFHQQLIYFTLMFFNGILNPVIHASLNFVVAFSVSFILSIVLHKYYLTCFLLGETKINK